VTKTKHDTAVINKMSIVTLQKKRNTKLDYVMSAFAHTVASSFDKLGTVDDRLFVVVAFLLAV